MTPVIDAHNVYKCYPGFPPVLRGININVIPGEMVAIMGPSGCGKSTMLHILGMLHAPDSGALKVLDVDVLTLTREETAAFRRGNMGFVMQSNNLFDHSTVFENVEFPLIYENVPPEERWERVIRALELVHLSHRVSYRSNRLSGGEQQRVAIARAMVNNPRILLADEPTGALDSRTSKVVMENFCTLAHEGGIAMVIVTHDPGVAEYCDSVYRLEDGILECQRKSPVPSISGTYNLLQAKQKLLNAVCVVDSLSDTYDTTAVHDVLHLYDKNMLSRVYALQGASLRSLVNGEYLLPIPIKKQGAWQTVLTMLRRTRSVQGNPGKVWQYWSCLPPGQRFNIYKAFKNIWYFFKGIRMVKWGLDDKVVHLHGLKAHAPATAAWVAAGILNIPFSFSLHTHDCKNLSYVAVKAKYATFVRCDTEETRAALVDACVKLDAHFPCEKIHVMHPMRTLTPPLEEDILFNTAQQGEVHILASGHVTKRKGLKFLLKACALLKKQKVPLRLTIAGHGSALFLLRVRALLLGLRKQVFFAGHVPHEHMPEMLRKAHIFVAPGVRLSNGEHDGISASLTEAMLFALPIVASDLAGHREVLEHEKTALIVPQRDATALCEALAHLARFPEKAEALGKAAQSYILHNAVQKSSEQQLAQCIQGKFAH